MKPTIILYDVDGTLITTGGAGRRALERAFEQSFGAPGDFEFPFGGMTDRGIFRQGMERSGHDVSDECFDALMVAYKEVLRAEVEAAQTYFVHPGVIDSLEVVSGHDHVAVGLGTGNIERGARIKLDRAELNSWFSFGGFGCDAEDRAELIAAGARRGAERLGVSLGECRLVIVGDTPRDVAAAHANGGVCLGVATGGSTHEDLTSSGADWTVPDLTHFDFRDLIA